MRRSAELVAWPRQRFAERPLLGGLPLLLFVIAPTAVVSCASPAEERAESAEVAREVLSDASTVALWLQWMEVTRPDGRLDSSWSRHQLAFAGSARERLSATDETDREVRPVVEGLGMSTWPEEVLKHARNRARPLLRRRQQPVSRGLLRFGRRARLRDRLLGGDLVTVAFTLENGQRWPKARGAALENRALLRAAARELDDTTLDAADFFPRVGRLCQIARHVEATGTRRDRLTAALLRWSALLRLSEHLARDPDSWRSSAEEHARCRVEAPELNEALEHEEPGSMRAPPEVAHDPDDVGSRWILLGARHHYLLLRGQLEVVAERGTFDSEAAKVLVESLREKRICEACPLSGEEPAVLTVSQYKAAWNQARNGYVLPIW